MKKRPSDDYSDENRAKLKASRSFKKNKQRLGGGGLSLEAFVNAKSRNGSFNPALVKKKREFYKNAKHVNKYKKSLKQQNVPETCFPIVSQPQEDNPENVKKNQRKKKEKSLHKLRELYEKQQAEEEQARMEREAYMKAKDEERRKAEAKKKALRQKMFKKTRSGQPVMKHRIEHLLQTLQGSTS